MSGEKFGEEGFMNGVQGENPLMERRRVAQGSAGVDGVNGASRKEIQQFSASAQVLGDARAAQAGDAKAA
ncbi:unnamed protein product [Ilex paraguariensis]|uniref:SMP domain-containing protein n=1 Tax=Ilex paraguariensis TaxID=185542 RepID=A0ABC8RKD3_9AQUA